MMNRPPAQDAELAAYYDAHIHDTDRWGEPVEPPPESRGRRLGATITVRFSAEEIEPIRRAARRLGKTYSAIVRDAVHQYTQPELSITASFADCASFAGIDLSEKLKRDERSRQIEIAIDTARRWPKAI